MSAMTQAEVKAIYRSAVDARASDAEGDAWWAQVQAELLAVIDAHDLASAASVIAWWHSAWEWQAIGDTAKAAAKRIRSVARVVVQPARWVREA